MPFTTLFFDLDDTLYPSSAGLWAAIRERMSLYMIERLKLPAEEVPRLRRFYYETYGTTLRGLQKHHHIDAEDYLAFVHELPLEKYLEPDAEVRPILLSLPQQCWIFTNADADHARRVLAVLGLADCFDGIIDVRAMQFACKPEAIAFQRALALAGSPDPWQCMLLDDAVANLGAAQRLGFTTVLVGQNGDSQPGAAYAIPSLGALPQALPILWEE